MFVGLHFIQKALSKSFSIIQRFENTLRHHKHINGRCLAALNFYDFHVPRVDRPAYAGLDKIDNLPNFLNILVHCSFCDNIGRCYRVTQGIMGTILEKLSKAVQLLQ